MTVLEVIFSDHSEEMIMQIPGKLSALVVGSVIAVSSSVVAFAADARFAGYLYDRSCADNLKAQHMLADEHHKKECALNPDCSRDGYAICSKGQWYQFDKKGNELARSLLKSTKTEEGHFVQVTGSLDKGLIKVSAIKELASQ